MIRSNTILNAFVLVLHIAHVAVIHRQFGSVSNACQGATVEVVLKSEREFGMPTCSLNF